ncbi:ADP-heptose:LPS heptosyltransferase [Tistlia consotensis]|uniref:ADP-heptose:LPS heptosyltransferase n=1 Tax=Tistlia consotensis USBA 355 TaxID=560819 RepID=A0A1Y6B9W7_9PROT|nr:glycosyltransferase family 9 protein [Tistlia consotensis]SME89265.1 ADP-heptose:LPS heptosyltransferase [Tistlia consotensis USBA 355]SNR25836.1 ADP-heptose:LPS heptosyltransferase [Tistlia consotensis]
MRLLFVTSTRLGDAVLSTGALDCLVRRHPGARVTVVAGPVAAPIFAGVPGLERIVVLRKKRAGLHWLELWGRLVRHRWAAVCDLRASALAWLLPAGRRYVIGRRDDSLHRVVELGRLLGEEPPPAPTLWTIPAHEAGAERILPSEGPPVLAIGPTANWAGKVWPAERFAEVALALTAADGPLPGARIAVIAAEHESFQANPVLAALPRDRRVNLVGRAPLPVLGAALARCRLYLGNDSGLMHLAAAAGCPTLGLFGPSPEWRYAPWGPRCAVVRTPESFAELKARPDFDFASKTRCYMESLAVAPVVEAATALLARTGR